MLITEEYVDKIAPSHGRTSCNDINRNNAYGGWDNTYNSKTGAKNILIPRCTRCYLLDSIGCDTMDLEFEPVVEVWLRYKGER
jgi:hypothetical protein